MTTEKTTVWISAIVGKITGTFPGYQCLMGIEKVAGEARPVGLDTLLLPLLSSPKEEGE